MSDIFLLFLGITVVPIVLLTRHLIIKRNLPVRVWVNTVLLTLPLLYIALVIRFSGKSRNSLRRTIHELFNGMP